MSSIWNKADSRWIDLAEYSSAIGDLDHSRLLKIGS